MSSEAWKGNRVANTWHDNAIIHAVETSVSKWF